MCIANKYMKCQLKDKTAFLSKIEIASSHSTNNNNTGYNFSDNNNKSHINNSSKNTNYNNKSKSKEIWDQSNNFSLKLSLFFIDYGIKPKSQKLPLKPQLAYYICSFSGMQIMAGDR